MTHNRLELILTAQAKAGVHHYEQDYQPFKAEGLYIVGSTEFILYGKRWTQAQMQQFVQDAINHKIKVQNETDNNWYSEHYQQYPYDYFEDYTIRAAFILFEFTQVVKNKEHLFLQDECKVTSFASLEDKTVLSPRETAKERVDNTERQRVENLKAISTWNPNPKNFLDGMAISTFAGEHFKAKTKEGIRAEFKKLSKVHHPDNGGESLMFTALSRTRDYLLDKIQGQQKQEVLR